MPCVNANRGNETSNNMSSLQSHLLGTLCTHDRLVDFYLQGDEILYSQPTEN